MKALVVYESMFGNTARVARAIAEGLRASMEVELCEVRDAPRNPADDISLIVAGGPTHAFSMSRERTRADAVARGARRGEVGSGLREWINSLPSDHHQQSLATFDSRVAKLRHLPGSAAKSAAKVGRKLGYTPLASPTSFYVDDVEGPLLAGELDRATAWGHALGSLVEAR